MPDLPVSHCGTVVDPFHQLAPMITCSPIVFCDDIGMVGVGDIVAAHAHPPNPLVEGSPITHIDNNDRPMGRKGDACACGATLFGNFCSNVFSD